jgi:protocatechuate 3,4-dioxygenase beta subunit
MTAPQTEGPFFKTNTPQRISFTDAPNLVITGQVLSLDCKPLKGALLDFWHADEHGEYDNRGFRYRGHQFSDAERRYRLETIVPAEYPGRARHLHVKVQPPGGRILTTQLYFPNQPGNARDGLFREELVMHMQDRSRGAFDFVVAA